MLGFSSSEFPKIQGFFLFSGAKIVSFREGKQHPLTLRVFPLTLPFAGIVEVSPSFFCCQYTYMLKLKLHSSHWDGDELSNWKTPSVLNSIATPKKKDFPTEKRHDSNKKSVPSPPSPTMFFGERIFFMTSPASKPDSSANLRSNFLVDP